MVEFALLAPIAFVLLFGVIDLGRAAYDNSVVASAAREGARSAVPGQEVSKTAVAIEQDVIGGVRRTLGGGVVVDTAGAGNVGGVYSAAGLGSGNSCPKTLAVGTARVYQDTATFDTVPHDHQPVTITVCYAYQPWTPLLSRVLPNGILEGSSTTMTTEY